MRRYKNQDRARLKQRVLNLLGRKCVKCGFDDERALCFDHIAGGGNREKKEIGSQQMLRLMLKQPWRYQVLCANCNLIKAVVENELNRKKYA
jgi:hypothetical protein